MFFLYQAVRFHIKTVMYGWRLALVPLEPVEAVVKVCSCAPAEEVVYDREPKEPPAISISSVPEELPIGKVTECSCAPEEAVVPVCVWLTTTASLLPPVSSALSNSGSTALKPTGTRPAPNATHVPKPNKVLGLAALVALM
jgi:hypothetical protein